MVDQFSGMGLDTPRVCARTKTKVSEGLHTP